MVTYWMTPLAQILAQGMETGISWLDPLLEAILGDYGAIGLLIVVVLVFIVITLNNTNKRADESERFVLDTAKDAKDTKDELIKTKDELSNFKIETAKKEGVFEGQIIELSRTVKHQQDKYELQEKIWGETRHKLEAEIERLTKESTESKERLAKLEEELKGKNAELERVTGERDMQKNRIADLERERLDKELEIERMKGLILEQETAIKKLKTELDSLKTVAVTTPEPPNEVIEKESDKGTE